MNRIGLKFSLMFTCMPLKTFIDILVGFFFFDMQHNFETPYVVRLHNCQVLAPPQEVFHFKHPNKGRYFYGILQVHCIYNEMILNVCQFVKYRYVLFIIYLECQIQVSMYIIFVHFSNQQVHTCFT